MAKAPRTCRLEVGGRGRQRGVGAVLVVPEREGKGLREREDKMGRECGGLYIIYLSILVVSALTLYAGTRGHNAQTTDIGAGVGYFGEERPPMDRTRR